MLAYLRSKQVRTPLMEIATKQWIASMILNKVLRNASQNLTLLIDWIKYCIIIKSFPILKFLDEKKKRLSDDFEEKLSINNRFMTRNFCCSFSGIRVVI